MTVAELIDYLKREGDRLCEPIGGDDGLLPMAFRCTSAERGVAREQLARDIAHCPEDLAQFWSIALTARLFEDYNYGQWGLAILSPQQANRATRAFRRTRYKDWLKGDLIIARFLGDSELLLVRGDPKAEDFGRVLVVDPIYRRIEWPTVAPSFGGFLNRYVEAAREKYWEPSCL